MASFLYDPLGRRVQKVAGGVTRKFTYDGEDILREKVVGVGNLRYIHGPGIDEPLGFQNVATSVMTYYHADGLGSIVRTSDSTGAVTSTRAYDSFGRPADKGANQPGYGYTGREWDPETGLYYYRARYYDPKIGRFISEDPLALKGGGPNFYAYVSNNPVNRTDPSGLVECCDCPSQEWYLDGGWTFSLSAGLGFSGSFGHLVCKQRPFVRRPVVVRCTSVGPMLGAGVGGDLQLPGKPSVSGICHLNPTGLPLMFTGWVFTAGPAGASTSDGAWNVSASLSASAGAAHQTCFVYPR